MKTNKFLVFGASLVVTLCGLLIFKATPALAATKTWDGSGGDNNMNTASNWAGDSAPTAGDDLVFPASAARHTITNNYTAATSFNSVTFNGDGDTPYEISGNSITLAAGGLSCTGSQGGYLYINIILSASQEFEGSSLCTLIIGDDDSPGLLTLGSNTLTLSGYNGIIFIYHAIAGAGNIVVAADVYGLLTGTNTYTGSTTVQQHGSLYVRSNAGLGGTGTGTTVQSGGTLAFTNTGADMSVAEPLNIAGSGVVGGADYSGYAGSLLYGTSGLGPNATGKKVTLSGTVTLSSDVSFAILGSSNTLEISGAIVGNYHINLLKGGPKSNKLVLSSSANGSKTANGQYTSEVLVVTITNSSPASSITVTDNTVYVINGTRGNTLVASGGILKGSGTVAELEVQSGGRLAPGQSPGCLTSSNLALITGSFLDIELGGTTACSGYDQQIVNGTVNLGSATLNVTRFNNFRPAAGQTYTIVNNDGSDAVTGTFVGLPEGASFTAGDGFVYRISYVGGSGNDVVLTVLTVPAAPDTGFAYLQNRPLITLTLTGGIVAAVVVAARQYRRRMARFTV